MFISLTITKATNAHMSTYYVEALSTFNEPCSVTIYKRQFDNPRQETLCSWLTVWRIPPPHPHHHSCWKPSNKVYTLIEIGGTFRCEAKSTLSWKKSWQNSGAMLLGIDDDVAALTWCAKPITTWDPATILTPQFDHSPLGLPTPKNEKMVPVTGFSLNCSNLAGSKTPLESKHDYRSRYFTDKPLRDTMQFLSDTVRADYCLQRRVRVNKTETKCFQFVFTWFNKLFLK